MSTTPHTAAVDEIFTLANGNQLWSTLLAAVAPGMHLGHKLFKWRVVSGGPVAIAKKAMTALADGAQFTITQGEEEHVGGNGVIQGSLINFFGAANATIRVQASNF